jgi:probable HAF family extracellular repeat protein
VINDRGQIIGITSVRHQHAFLWANGKRRDLGTLGGLESEPVAINERGQIVGISETAAAPGSNPSISSSSHSSTEGSNKPRRAGLGSLQARGPRARGELEMSRSPRGEPSGEVAQPAEAEPQALPDPQEMMRKQALDQKRKLYESVLVNIAKARSEALHALARKLRP